MTYLLRIITWSVPYTFFLVPIFVFGLNTIDNHILANPVGVESVQELIKRIVQAIIVISLPVMTVTLVYAGFLFITARGGSGLNEAKSNLLWVFIGIAILLGAWAFTVMIGTTVRQIMAP